MKWKLMRGVLAIAIMLPGIHLVYGVGGWKLFWGITILILANNISQWKGRPR